MPGLFQTPKKAGMDQSQNTKQKVEEAQGAAKCVDGQHKKANLPFYINNITTNIIMDKQAKSDEDPDKAGNEEVTQSSGKV